MSSQLVPRDVEALTVGFLDGLMSEFVSTDLDRAVDGTPTVPCVRVQLVGGNRTNMVTDRSMIALQGYAVGAVDAQQVTARAFAHMLSAGEISPANFRWVEPVGAVVPFPDPFYPNLYRYQATVQVDVRPTLTGA